MAITADDIAQINNAAALYGHAIDHHEWDRLGEVYAADGVYDGSATGSMRHEGLEAIVHYLSTTEQPVVHHATNLHLHLADATDTEVSGRTKWFVVRANGTVASGDYHDTWTKTAEGWRLKERTSFRITATAAPVGATTA
jgi:uncharacterized surface anchored protein